jgi:hypothetical protein
VSDQSREVVSEKKVVLRGDGGSLVLTRSKEEPDCVVVKSRAKFSTVANNDKPRFDAELLRLGVADVMED